MKYLAIATASLLVAAPAFAQDGDAAAGEEQFNRQCVACHVVQNEEGETLAGRNAQTGPNLYGVAGRPIGSMEGFRYGDSIVEAGEEGMTWTEENFVGYVQDPSGWLKEVLDDSGARGKMVFRVRSEDDAHDLYAFLASMGPEGGAEGEEAATN